jgi:hypothetical protein
MHNVRHVPVLVHDLVHLPKCVAHVVVVVQWQITKDRSLCRRHVDRVQAKDQSLNIPVQHVVEEVWNVAHVKCMCGSQLVSITVNVFA